MLQKTKNKKGFTLIETIIAIAILSLSVSAALSLAASSIKFSSLARDKLIGGNLAQEGIELILAHRVTNSLNERSWLTGLVGASSARCDMPTGCKIDAATRVPVDCAGDGAACAPLRIDSNSVYSYQIGGTVTPFTRQIRIEPIGATEAKITSTVTWTNRFGTQSIILKEYIEDWI